MKRIFTLIAALVMSFHLAAQCPLTEAVDFTATDCHGTQVHLFDILDRGRYVLIDFFFASCGPCQTATPKVAQAYTALGCNQHDVFFMEISYKDHDNTLQNWCNTYGIEYPTIGIEGGEPSIDDAFNIPQYPAIILIAPDRQIVIQDLWPIASAQTVINALAPYGIQQHDCNTVTEPSVDITFGEVTSTTIEATFTSNAECASYTYLCAIQSEMENWMVVTGMTLEELVQAWGIHAQETSSHVFDGLISNTEYTVYVLPFDSEDSIYALQTKVVKTAQLGGTGVSQIELQVEVLSDTTVKTIAIPNAETAEYYYGLITKAYYEEIGADSALQVIRGNGHPLYGNDEWIWVNLAPNTHYYALRSGKNANGEWGETVLVEFVTSTDHVDGMEVAEYQVAPNPANNHVMISGKSMSDVAVFNNLGQQVLHEAVKGEAVTVETSGLEKGIYFVRINGSIVKRTIIAH